jgi:hypothetical protein
MQIEMQWGYIHTPVTMLNIIAIFKRQSDDEDAHQLLVHICMWQCTMLPLQKTIWLFFIHLKLQLPDEPAVTLFIYPKERKTYFCTKILV